MTMYLNNVPLANQRINDTQAPINQNFVTIDTAFQIDHVPYTLSGQGFHTKVTFPTGIAKPVLIGTQVVLYQANYTVSTSNELWFARSAAVGGGNIPMTASRLLSPGWSYLPSGIILKWGQGTCNTTTQISFPTGANYPVYTAPPLAILITPNNAASALSTSVALQSIDSAAKFTVNCTGTQNFTYLAIGF